MPTTETGFVPFGEFKPDLRYLVNDGLVRAFNVLPVYNNYITAPSSTQIAEVAASGDEFGLHFHKVTGDGYAAVNIPGAPARVHLYQVTAAGVVTDRSRAATYQNLSDFSGASFGPYVVMTNYDDEVQYRDGGGATAFANMITSTFAPRAKFAFPLGNNLFLANCFLPGAYDTLAAGANPTLVAWSQSENIRSFGSYNANPELIGAGYQPLNYDLGPITGAIAGSGYGIIAFSDGFARVDGPPYTFRVVSDAVGCNHPYSLCAIQGDIWFWGPSGLTRLPGGENQPEVVGLGIFTRALIDNATGFFEAAWLGDARISMAYDSTNGLLFAAYRSQLPQAPGGWAQTYLCYNIAENRASYGISPVVIYNPGPAPNYRPMHFLRTANQGVTGTGWTPGGTVRFLTNLANAISYQRLTLGQIDANIRPTLERGYLQFKIGQTTRIRRIRPIYGVTDQSAIEKIQVYIASTNKPYATPSVSGPYEAVDSSGWITTQNTVFADFHSPKFIVNMTSANNKVVEYERFEYEIELGGTYGA